MASHGAIASVDPELPSQRICRRPVVNRIARAGGRVATKYTRYAATFLCLTMLMMSLFSARGSFNLVFDSSSGRHAQFRFWDCDLVMLAGTREPKPRHTSISWWRSNTVVSPSTKDVVTIAATPWNPIVSKGANVSLSLTIRFLWVFSTIGIVLLWAPRIVRWIVKYRLVRGCCVRCGYNLTGNVSGVCPECGCATKAPGKVIARLRQNLSAQDVASASRR